MLAWTMRSAGWCVCVIALAGCGDRPLGAPDAAAISSADASVDAGPPPGSIGAAEPVGIADPTGGATDVGPVVALDDGGAIVAGSFSGTVSFASDKTLTAQGARDGFVARYRSDARLVWVRPLVASAGTVVISGAAGLSGNEVAIAGWFAGTLTVGPAAGATLTLTSAGGLDGFVARLASDGSVRWAVRAGGAGDDIIRSLAAGPPMTGVEGVILPGPLAVTGAAGFGAVFGPGEPRQVTLPGNDGPIFAASYSATDGTLAWASFGGGGTPSQGYGVAVDGLWRVAVTGYVNGPAIFGQGMARSVTIDPAGGRAVTAVWDDGGRFVWARGLGGPAGEGDAVAFTSTGDALVTGTFEGQWGFTAAGGPVTLAADSPGQPGCFLAQLGAAGGAPSWARRLAGRGLRPWRLHRFPFGDDWLIAASFGGGTTFDPDGRAPVTVRAAGNDDAVFLRLDPAGALRWATTLGGPGDDEGGDVAVAGDDLIWATGRYVGPVAVSTASAPVTLGSGTDGAGFLLHLVP